MLLSGKEFNKKYKNKTFVKLTKKDEIHNDFEFKTGLNVDIVPFNPSGSCRRGGLYFTDTKYLYKWINYDDEPMKWLRYVSIPRDANVYVEDFKYKCDKFILSERREITLNDIITTGDAKTAILLNNMPLIYVKEQTPEICIKAVKKDGYALEYVIEQTPEICIEAVKQDGRALEFVKEQTPEICIEAVKQNGYALRFVKEQTPEICIEAVKQDGWALEYIKEQTPEICIDAVKHRGLALKCVKKQTPEICIKAVKKHGRALQFVKEQTPEICIEAVKQNSSALQFVKEQSSIILCTEAIKNIVNCQRE